MKRRALLQLATSLGLASVLAGVIKTAAEDSRESSSTDRIKPLVPPADGRIPVAFLLSEGAVVIDFAGPWEVFENVEVPGPTSHPFQLFTVAESEAPILASGGMRILPNYTLAAAPLPKIAVIPAQSTTSPAVVDWIRKVSKTADLVMSVCTGAFVLAETGLLAGKPATTHHSAYADLAMSYPQVFVKRGARFVEVGNLATAGGLSSGIDLALRVVERYFGKAVAQSTADTLEYQGLGWTDPHSNSAYAKRRVSTDAHPLCAVCEMDIDRATAPSSQYRGHAYYFCMPAHKALFDSKPELFA